MGEFFGGLLVLASPVLFILGLVALIKPLPKLKLGSRKRAGLALLGSVVAMGVGGALLPDPATTPAKPADKPAEKASKPEAKPAAPVVDAEAVKSQTLALWKQVVAATEVCDKANGTAGEVVGRISSGRASVYDGYNSAKQAEQVCRDATMTLGDLEPPAAVKGDTRQKFSKALENCQLAYVGKQMAMEKMAKILDGNMRPSAVAEFQETAQAAQSGALVCAAGFMTAADAAGVKIEDLKLD